MAKNSLPMVTLRDLVSLPGSILPLYISRQRSLAALDAALSTDDRAIILCTQRDPDVDDPVYSDLYEVGTVAEIYQMLKFPDGTGKVLLEARYRIRLESMKSQDYLTGEFSELSDVESTDSRLNFAKLVAAYDRWAHFSETPRYVWIRFPADYENQSLATDRMAAHLPMDVEDKINCLSQNSVAKRIEVVLGWTEKLQAEHGDELEEFEQLWEETPTLTEIELADSTNKNKGSLMALFPEAAGGKTDYSAKPDNLRSSAPQLTYQRISNFESSLYITDGLAETNGCEIAVLTKGGPTEWPFTFIHQITQSLILKHFNILEDTTDDGFTVVFANLPQQGICPFLIAQLSQDENPVLLAVALHEDEADVASLEELLDTIKQALGGRFSVFDRAYLY